MLVGIGPGVDGANWLPSGSGAEIVVASLGFRVTLLPRESVTVTAPRASATVVRPLLATVHSRLVPRMPMVATGVPM